MNFHGGDVYSCTGEVLDFSSNINPLGVPASFREALWEHLDDFTRYPDLQYRALKESFAEYLSFDKPEMIIPGNGAVEIIFKGIMALDIDTLVNLSPTFSEYAHAAEQKGVPVLDLNAYNEDYQDLNLEHVLSLIQRKSVVVLCNPNNPTGTFVDKEKMCALAGTLKEKDSYLLIDEAFIEFTDGYPQNSMVSELGRFPNVLVIRAATKFFGMPGIRLGFGVTGNLALVQGIKEQLEPWNVNAAAVIAGCTVYRDQKYIAASRLWVQEERQFLFDRLREIPELTVYPSRVNYHLVKINEEKIDAWKLKELLLGKGILIRTPDGFHHLSPYHFRLAVKDRASNEMMLTALREVCSVYG
ncbi:pyridoxal phosphate-dependent aminotransferase [Dehalobacterium formicoaceticum]|uniref:pyridoxal phosphate-dependent aminotransferase n=1 Tax=Dehalobacterium formicoaceticum TaxID=51515 RepID=UPI000B7F9AA8|nr:threonine-phosphate decarboxylase [Dehalobacterium formicoaceticum]